MDRNLLELKDELVRKIVVFLKEIGLEVIHTRITSETFLPGILVDQGKLLIDEDRGYFGRVTFCTKPVIWQSFPRV